MRGKNRTSSSCLLQVINLLLAVTLIISVVLAILLINTEILLFQPATYQKALQDQNVYARLPGLIAEQIAGGTTDPCIEDPNLCTESAAGPDTGIFNPSTSLLKNIGKENWEMILTTLLPQDWLKRQTESVIDQVFADLNANEPVDPAISLEGLKQNLTDGNLIPLVKTILASAPPCQAEELVTMASIALGISDASVPICMPPDELRPVVEEALLLYLRASLNELPEQVTIQMGRLLQSDNENTQTENYPPGGNPLGPLKTIRLIFLASPLVSLVVLALLTLTAVRSWSGLGHWWGVPLLFAGLLVLVIAALGLTAFNWIMDSLVIPFIPGALSAGLEQMVAAVTQEVASRYMLWISIEAGFILLIGAGLLAFSWLTRRRYWW